eukprot:GHVU01107993.1.p2 GENE.GHVU01107993.1~~GHVU01107993.1.p2  ORF type:complete len:376 (-),score=45.30 GHVU01107993.1:750-1877(-)
MWLLGHERGGPTHPFLRRQTSVSGAECQMADAIRRVSDVLKKFMCIEDVVESTNPFDRPVAAAAPQGQVVELRTPFNNAEGIPAIDNRRKAVSNTWVVAVLQTVLPDDAGAPAAVATGASSVSRHGSAFLTHTQPDEQPQPQGVSPLRFTRVHVTLTGVLVGKYTVNGWDLEESLTTTLGAQYADTHAGFTSAEKQEWVLKAIEVVCLAIARLDILHPHLRDKAPPVTPFQYSRMDQPAFMALVDTHMPRFNHTLPVPTDGVDNREEVLRVQLQDEHVSLFQTRVSEPSCNQPLGEIWALYKDRYPTMWLLARGLATIFPGDAEVERTFAQLKNRYNDRRYSVTTLTLAGELTCSQMKRLRQLLSPPDDRSQGGA